MSRFLYWLSCGAACILLAISIAAAVRASQESADMEALFVSVVCAVSAVAVFGLGRFSRGVLGDAALRRNGRPSE